MIHIKPDGQILSFKNLSKKSLKYKANTKKIENSYAIISRLDQVLICRQHIKGNKIQNYSLLKYKFDQRYKRALETIKEVSESEESDYCRSKPRQCNSSSNFNFNQWQHKQKKGAKKEINEANNLWKIQLLEDEILAVSIILINILSCLIFKIYSAFQDQVI